MKSLLGKLGVILIGLIVFGFFLVSSANAELRIKDYKRIKDTEIFKTYILGVGVGVEWANTVVSNRGQSPLYCAPGKLAITTENFLQILQDYIEKNPEIIKPLGPDLPIGLLLLKALQDAFPCK